MAGEQTRRGSRRKSESTGSLQVVQICIACIMHICMKPSRQELNSLIQEIQQKRREQALTLADIGRMANVHSSHVSRICAGRFLTISNNVVQVCKVLGVQIESVASIRGETDHSWSQLERSLRNLWDQTPEGAKRIGRILDTIAEWREES